MKLSAPSVANYLKRYFNIFLFQITHWAGLFEKLFLNQSPKFEREFDWFQKQISEANN